MKQSLRYEFLLEQGMHLLQFYRNNPVIAAYDLLGVDFAPIQRLIFNDMWFKNYVIAVISRSGGKTHMLGILSCLSSLLYPGYRVGLIGPVFRQSKMIFSEVEKLYGRSSILREACEKEPTKGADTCYLRFKSVGGANNSLIEGLPLGDGSKIRESRFHLILVDELAQVSDKTLDLATEDDSDDAAVNKMVMTSSGYYKFNHMWRRMRDYWRQMELEGDACQYSVWQVPYWYLPEGFFDKDNIEEAKRIMSSQEFRMEYEAAMI